MEVTSSSNNYTFSTLQGVYDAYIDIMHTRADRRTERLPLVKSPIPLISTLAIYLLFCWLGPKWMKHRKAWELRGFMIFYNFALVILSVYMVVEYLLSAWLWRFSLGCEPIDWRDTPENWRLIQVSYLFWISKWIELLDTVIFILRKKNNQITALHIIHHTGMPIAWYLGLKFAAGGMGTFHGMVNSFVHVVMYSYYGLAAIGPQMQKYLTWKKYITKLQLTQFIIVFIHTSQLHFIECDYPRTFLYMINSYTVVFFVLFSNFYIQTYIKKRRAANAKHHADVDKMNAAIANGHDLGAKSNGVHYSNGVANGKKME